MASALSGRKYTPVDFFPHLKRFVRSAEMERDPERIAQLLRMIPGTAVENHA